MGAEEKVRGIQKSLVKTDLRWFGQKQIRHGFSSFVLKEDRILYQSTSDWLICSLEWSLFHSSLFSRLCVLLPPSLRKAYSQVSWDCDVAEWPPGGKARLQSSPHHSFHSVSMESKSAVIRFKNHPRLFWSNIFVYRQESQGLKQRNHLSRPRSELMVTLEPETKCTGYSNVIQVLPHQAFFCLIFYSRIHWFFIMYFP